MKLKVFLPDLNEQTASYKYIPFLIAFLRTDLSEQEKRQHYGDWLNLVEIVDNVEACDILMPACYVNHYYETNQKKLLKGFNETAVNNGKLTVCWTSGDFEITPSLQNFHLYRPGGYLSKNKGNEFSFPIFFGDPLKKYFNNVLPVHTEKKLLPLIGFCGQGKAVNGRRLFDVVRNVYRAGLKLIGKWPFDKEQWESNVYRRSVLLNQLEKSGLVATNFIRYRQYRGGAKNKVDKEKSSLVYYDNMRTSDYIFCYRGTGNFSVRLYEAMASGKIPFIITSDNNLPFRGNINWGMFPTIAASAAAKPDVYLSSFHKALTNEAFINLQLEARKIWEEYLSYRGFMKQWVYTYSKT